MKAVIGVIGGSGVYDIEGLEGAEWRAVATPWLKNYLKAEPKLQSVAHAKPRCTEAFDCLAHCGLR